MFQRLKGPILPSQCAQSGILYNALMFDQSKDNDIKDDDIKDNDIKDDILMIT